MRRALPSILLLCLLCLRGWGQTVWTNWNGGSDHPYVVVWMPDGYTDEEQINAADHMQKAAAGVLSDPSLVGLTDRLLFVTLFAASNESGASYYGRTEKDTRYGSTFNYAGQGERVLVTTKGYQAIADASAAGFIGVSVVVVCNSTIYGGTGGNPVSVSRHVSVVELIRHELLGHNIADAGDEYTTPYPGFPLLRYVNIAISLSDIPWQPMLDAHVPGVGIVEGGLYRKTGVWKPSSKCKMNTLGTPWCPVCFAAIRDAITANSQPARLKRRAGSIAFTISVT